VSVADRIAHACLADTDARAAEFCRAGGGHHDMPTSVAT
jgi:hypothetical protein